MRIEVREEPITTLEDYASIPIAFEVGSILDVMATTEPPNCISYASISAVRGPADVGR